MQNSGPFFDSRCRAAPPLRLLFAHGTMVVDLRMGLWFHGGGTRPKRVCLTLPFVGGGWLCKVPPSELGWESHGHCARTKSDTEYGRIRRTLGKSMTLSSFPCPSRGLRADRALDLLKAKAWQNFRLGGVSVQIQLPKKLISL